MTEDRMALLELAEKHADGDFLRELGQWTLQRLMELEAQTLCGAKPHERSEDRVNQRNGYRPRQLETRIGTMDLKIPKLRHGSYLPAFLDPRKASERALVAVVQEAYVKGISTRKVDDLVQAMGMTGISKSQVSRLYAELGERVEVFLNRPVEGSWPYLWLDATYLKSRENGQVLSKAVVLAVGVNAIVRLLGTLMAEQTDEWQVTRRYMSMDTLNRVIGKMTDDGLLLEDQEAA